VGRDGIGGMVDIVVRLGALYPCVVVVDMAGMVGIVGILKRRGALFPCGVVDDGV